MSEKHPVQIGVQFNHAMKRWDAVLMAGNFASEAAAREYVERIKELLQNEANGKFVRPS